MFRIFAFSLFTDFTEIGRNTQGFYCPYCPPSNFMFQLNELGSVLSSAHELTEFAANPQSRNIILAELIAFSERMREFLNPITRG